MMSNANTFRAHRYAEEKMMALVMPRTAAWTGEEPDPTDTVVAREPRPSTLRVSLGEVSRTRLFGFRAVQEVQ